MPTPEPGPFSVVSGGVTYNRFTDASVDMSIESVGFSFAGNVFVPYGQSFPFSRFQKVDLFYKKEKLFSAIIEQPIDGYSDSGSSTQLNGGSKTMALAYSSVEPKQRSFKDVTLFDLVSALATPHGISVSQMPGVDTGEKFKHFRIDAGRTVVDAITEACSERGLLCFTNDGESLVIGRPINGPAAYTLPTAARKAKSASIGGETTQIGSTYTVVGGGNVNGKSKRSFSLANPNITLVRPIVIQASRGKTNAELEAIARRALRAREGRALNAQIKVAGWTDQFGKVFRSGTLVRLTDSRLRLGGFSTVDETLVISDVNLTLGDDGPWASLRLKRPDAYAEE